jgi:hypothetical protein
MVIVGHGVIVRQVRVVSEPRSVAEEVDVQLRRYRCRSCRAVLLVGPRGLVPGRRYSGPAIAVALARYGRGDTSASTRAAVSPDRVVGGSAIDRWAALGRWVDAVRHGGLFAIRGVEGATARERAKAVTLVLAARGGHQLGGDLLASVLRGAAAAA